MQLIGWALGRIEEVIELAREWTTKRPGQAQAWGAAWRGRRS